MGIEKEAVAGRKGKKRKREKKNEERFEEIRHSGNVVVEIDKCIFKERNFIEKNNVEEINNVDKGDKKEKMRKNKKVNVDLEVGDNKGDKIIFEKEDVMEKDNVDKDVTETNNVDEWDIKKKKKKKKKKANVDSEDSDGKDGVEHAEKDGKKNKKKKREKKRAKDDVSAVQRDATAWKAVDIERENGKDVEISGEGRKGKVMEKVEKKKMKREKGKIEDDLEGVEITREGCDGEVMKKVERKKRKREKGQTKDELGAGGKDILAKNLASAEGNLCSTGNEIQDGDVKSNSIDKRKEANLAKKGSDDMKAKKRKKKGRFSGHVEVSPLSVDSNSLKSTDGDDKLLRGRFSLEELEIIKAAVYRYIREYGLGKEGLNMILNCRSHPEVRGCWKHIAKAIPYRPRIAIYKRARKSFQMGEKRKWTQEDFELLKKLQGEHGNRWTLFAEKLGTYCTQVTDTWRRIKLLNKKRGRWSQEEYQTLFDLVNNDLRLKLSEEKNTKHGRLRDNIHWTAISDRLSSRSDSDCCSKWYGQLTSPMVAEGLWADADDYRLINALFNLDSSCIENVDWDNLFDHRSGDVCRRRWNQMVLQIGQHGSKSFAEQVEILSRRYCPSLVGVREALDSRPVVA